MRSELDICYSLSLYNLIQGSTDYCSYNSECIYLHPNRGYSKSFEYPRGNRMHVINQVI